MLKTFVLSFIFLITLGACQSTAQQERNPIKIEIPKELEQYQRAYFASGCFWCVEAVYESVEGVKEVYSGYSGGQLKNPTYKEISTGRLEHAEAVEVFYDSTEVDFATLLTVFFDSHDPTTFNRQGPDVGPQYRSMIFYQNTEERQIALDYIEKLKVEEVYDRDIATEVVAFDKFYYAEAYHQDFEQNNPNNPYIRNVSKRRLQEFQYKHPDLLKKSGH